MNGRPKATRSTRPCASRSCARTAVTGNRVADDGDAVRRWALAGQGLAYKSLLDVVPDLLAGTLLQLCPHWQGEAAPLSLICTDRRQLSPTVVLLRDHLRARCRASLAHWSGSKN